MFETWKKNTSKERSVGAPSHVLRYVADVFPRLAKDTPVYVFHVHLTDSDVDVDSEHDMQDSSLATSGSPVDESKWMGDAKLLDGGYGNEAPRHRDMRTAPSVSVIPTTTDVAEPQPLVYSHDTMRLSHRQGLGLNMSQSPGAVTSPSNSFDGSVSYSSQELDASVQPTMVPPQISSVRHLDGLLHHERPSLPQYLGQPMLMSGPTPPTSVMWNMPLDAPASAYQHF